MNGAALSLPLPWRALLARHERLAACIVSVLLLVAVNRLHAVTEFPYDAATYWDLALPDMIGRTTYRGYVYPYLLRPLRLLADLTPDPIAAMGVLLSLAYGLVLPTLLPAFFSRAFGARVSFARRVLPVALLALLFPGVLLYPLSDLPALLVAIGALLCMLQARGAPGLRLAAAFALAAGALAGAAYNIRTIYLFALPGVFLLALLGGPHVRGASARIVLLAAVAAGLLLSAVPQRVINQRIHGIASFSVLAQVQGQNLFATQLVWGLTLQRYETSVGPDQPRGGVYYLDPAGEALFRHLAPRRNAFSIGDYLALAALRPLEFAGLYARHVVNGLDVRDGMVYVRKPSPARPRVALLNFLVLALAAWVAVAGLARAAPRPLAPLARTAVFAALLLPVAAIVPAAIESRFFLPLHVVAYGWIAFRGEAAALREAWTLWRWWLVASTLAVGALFFAVSSATMGQIAYGWPETYRHGLP